VNSLAHKIIVAARDTTKLTTGRYITEASDVFREDQIPWSVRFLDEHDQYHTLLRENFARRDHEGDVIQWTFTGSITLIVLND